ncbi:hypothetical protein [Nocardioides pantholopis]|uniref:hypothetical protein n=1 Tax=Nocardioides pantholopis TaxID=2483798 RepID=UPI000FDA8E2E|nr:hypothetical protein [Nocardioides pantholopis]
MLPRRSSRSPVRWRPSSAVGVLAAALLLAGCSVLDDEAAGPESVRVPDPVPREAATNPDRDADVVARRLAALDPCALGRAGAPPGATARALAPTRCQVTAGPSYRAVQVTVGAGLPQDTRYHRTRRILAGVVAYRESPALRPTCGWYLPVSQELAIEVSSSDGACAQSRRIARGVATLLRRDPAAAAAEPSPAMVPPCEWVRLGHGGLTEDQTLSRSLFGDGEEAGRCSVRGPRTGVLPSPLVLGVALDHVVEENLRHPAAPARRVRVAGRVAAQHRQQGECELAVAVAPLPGPAVGPADVLRARVLAPTCAEARRAATRMLTAVDARDHSAPDLGGEPVLYPAAKSDLAAVGSCADIRTAVERECAPAGDAEVPSDPAELLLAAQADPAVTCAALLPYVREHFGAQMVAGTGTVEHDSAVAQLSGEQGQQAPACLFGEPTHALHLTVGASWATLRDVAGAGSREASVAGHPARALARLDQDLPTLSWAVALDEADQPGVLTVDVQVTQDRDRGLWLGEPVDRSLLDPALGFVEDVTVGLLG